MKKKILPIAASVLSVIFISMLLKYTVFADSKISVWQKKIISSVPQNKAFLNQGLAKSISKKQQIPGEFVECFSSVSPEIRRNALAVLENFADTFPDQETINEILHITLEDEDSQVRSKSALALLRNNNIQIDIVKRIYNLEQSKEVQCYLGGIIGLSLKARDIFVLREHLKNDSEYMRKVLEIYTTCHQSLWSSLKTGEIAAVVADIAPVLEETTLKKEVSEFLQHITKSTTAYTTKKKWFYWVNSVYKKHIANSSEEQLKEQFFDAKISNAKRFSIAKQLKLYPNDISLCLEEFLKSEGQLDYVFSQIDQKYYRFFIKFVHLRYKNSRYLVDFLLRKSTVFCNDFLIENMDSLLEDERQILLQQIQQNPEQSTYEVTIFDNGAQIQILKSSNYLPSFSDIQNNNSDSKNTIKEQPKEIKVTPVKKVEPSEKNTKENILKKKYTTTQTYFPQQPIILESSQGVGAVTETAVYDLKASAIVDCGEVQVTLIIPESVSYLRSKPRAEINGRKLTWKYDIIQKNKHENMRVWFVPNKAGEQSFFSFAKATPITRSSMTFGQPQIKITLEGSEKENFQSPFSYKLQIHNFGSAKANKVMASFILPKGLSHKSGSTLPFPIGTLQAAETKTIEIVVRGVLPGNQCCEVEVTSSNHETVNAKSCCQIQHENFAISVEAPDELTVNDGGLVTITVKNTGGLDLENIYIHADFAQGSQIISHDISDVKKIANTLSWTQGILPADEQITFSVLTTSSQQGKQCIKVEAISNSNKEKVESCIDWQEAPKLKVIHSSINHEASLGKESVFKIIVQNIGNVEAKNVKITVLPSSQLQYQQQQFEIDNLGAGEEKQIEVKVTALQKGDIKSIAQVKCDGSDKAEDCVTIFVKD
ncbi:CARDB domain-containing protein [Candidatus Uabimicrobium sp. HlEnr_7]|uniref:CARDB domain-containing protein n=1 Tax=Candidatus Uabimicrobium helgolandensis TaxID=3095367 RepID=UPI003555C280